MKAVVYAGTKKVYSQMYTAMKSLYINCPNIDKIYFLIEDDKFIEELPNKVECINVSNQKWIKKDCPNLNPHWGGYMNQMRLVLAKIFPNLDKILSLDIDTIVLQDITELWDLDMNNFYIAGVRDTAQLNKNGLYINGGVLLQNLDNIRHDKIDDKLLESIHKIKYRFCCQGPINEIMKNKILELPSRYNSCSAFMNYSKDDQKIIHYAGYRNYVNLPQVKYYENLNIFEEKQ